MTNRFQDVPSALDGLVFDPVTIASSRSGLCGLPTRLLDAMPAAEVKDLVSVSYIDEIAAETILSYAAAVLGVLA